ncbi:MAG: hypothetical protein ACLFV3_09260 [Phycisphaeraceae bacterium]
MGLSELTIVVVAYAVGWMLGGVLLSRVRRLWRRRQAKRPPRETPETPETRETPAASDASAPDPAPGQALIEMVERCSGQPGPALGAIEASDSVEALHRLVSLNSLLHWCRQTAHNVLVLEDPDHGEAACRDALHELVHRVRGNRSERAPWTLDDERQLVEATIRWAAERLCIPVAGPDSD